MIRRHSGHSSLDVIRGLVTLSDVIAADMVVGGILYLNGNQYGWPCKNPVLSDDTAVTSRTPLFTFGYGGCLRNFDRHISQYYG